VLALVPEDSSTAKLELGDVLTVAQLIEGMMLPSGNDAAKLLATEVGRKIAGDPALLPADAITVFVSEMNYQAQALGLTGTRFANPDGYHDENHYSCFNDLVTIAKLALVNETIMNCSTRPYAHIVPLQGKEKDWINTNFLVNPEYEYYCPYAVGLKTGQTDAAGKCQLSAFDIEGHQYIIGVFGSTGFNERLDDTLQLLNAKVIGQSTP
jgi:D-alanyl-D-alanine carboxypeptidase (penicillin-binding protein 5/6)